MKNYFNFVPRFVRTKQDAQQTIDAYKTCKTNLLSNPAELKTAFAVVKPPFKCKDCKRKITLADGVKFGKEKLCDQCAQATFLKGYQHLKRSETLAGPFAAMLSSAATASGNRPRACRHSALPIVAWRSSVAVLKRASAAPQSPSAA